MEKRNIEEESHLLDFINDTSSKSYSSDKSKDNPVKSKASGLSRLPQDKNNSVKNGISSDPFYEGLVSFLGGIFGLLGSYLFCCCNPYTTVDEGHQLAVTRFGRYKETLPPGYHYLRPLTDKGHQVSIMTRSINLPEQCVFTKDNVTAQIDGSVYYKIINTYTATFEIEGLHTCLNQLALSALRGCFAKHTLQDCLEHRDTLSAEIQEYMIEHIGEWGIEVSSIVIKDIHVSEEMQRHLSSAASADREAKAKVIEAKGEVKAAKRYRKAAESLNTPAALQIRYLETMKSIASNPGTRVLFVPLGPSDNISGIAAAMEGIKDK